VGCCEVANLTLKALTIIDIVARILARLRASMRARSLNFGIWLLIERVRKQHESRSRDGIAHNGPRAAPFTAMGTRSPLEAQSPA